MPIADNGKKRRSAMFMALEPRILLDAAAAVVAGDLIQDALSADATEVTEIQKDQLVDGAESVADGTDAVTEASSLEAAAVGEPLETRREIAFVDVSVPDAESLIAGLSSSIEVYRIDGSSSGLAQISEILAGQSDIDALHILSHGSAGELSLGTDIVTSDTIDFYSSQLAALGSSLASDGDILLYGCDLGQDGVLIERFSDLTGADVAASTDDTGSSELGGDWDLERTVGTVDAHALVADGYTGILGDYALTFDGTDDYARSSAAIDLGNTFTISFWMNADQLKDYGDPLSAGTADQHLCFVTYESGKMTFGVGDGSNWGSSVKTDEGVFQSGQWYHIVGVATGTNLQLYVNGSLVGTSGANSNSLNQVINIGGRTATGYYFDGRVDEVGIWNEAFDATTISALYNAGSPISLTSDSGNYSGRTDNLLAYWTFNEGSGTTVVDSSGNSKSLTVYNGAAWAVGAMNEPSVGSGLALDFDGTSNSVEMGTTLVPTGGSAYTVEMWFYADNFANGTGYQEFVSQWVDAEGDDFYLGLAPGGGIRFGSSL